MLGFIICGIIFFLVIILIGKILKWSLKRLIKIAINIALGFLVIYLLNLIPNVGIPYTWWSGIIVGILGIPGALVCLIISFII